MPHIKCLVFVLVMLLSPYHLFAGESSTHFGFQYLSTYDECRRNIEASYGAASIISTEVDSVVGSIVKLPSILFSAPFNNRKSLNTLKFTPISKQLFLINHLVTLDKQGASADSLSEWYNTIMHYQKLLNRKYGHTKPMKMDKKWELNLFIQDWKTKDWHVTLRGFYNWKDTPHSIMLEYISVKAGRLKDEEQLRIETEQSKGL